MARSGRQNGGPTTMCPVAPLVSGSCSQAASTMIFSFLTVKALYPVRHEFREMEEKKSPIFSLPFLEIRVARNYAC